MKYWHRQCALTSTDVRHTVVTKVSCQRLVSMFLKLIPFTRNSDQPDLKKTLLKRLFTVQRQKIIARNKSHRMTKPLHDAIFLQFVLQRRKKNCMIDCTRHVARYQTMRFV